MRRNDREPFGSCCHLLLSENLHGLTQPGGQQFEESETDERAPSI